MFGIGGISDTIGTVGFNANLLAVTMPTYMFSKVFPWVLGLAPTTLQEFLVMFMNVTSKTLTCLSWRIALMLSPWVSMRVDGLKPFRSQMGSSGRPVVVIGNHVSFFDTVVMVALTPLSKVGRVKMFVSDHLYKMPILGVIVRAMGHFSVPFKSRDANTMSVDKDAMAERQRQMEAHVAGGGYAAWFPEGRLNPEDCSKVGQFRAGGMMLCCKTDVEVWCVAQVGNAVMWPRKAPVGGRPAKIGLKIFRLCESSKEFVAGVVSADLSEEERLRAESIFFANRAQAEIQTSVDLLVAEGFQANPSRTSVALQ